MIETHTVGDAAPVPAMQVFAAVTGVSGMLYEWSQPRGS